MTNDHILVLFEIAISLSSIERVTRTLVNDDLMKKPSRSALTSLAKKSQKNRAIQVAAML